MCRITSQFTSTLALAGSVVEWISPGAVQARIGGYRQMGTGELIVTLAHNAVHAAIGCVD
jgi:hypothetical protein